MTVSPSFRQKESGSKVASLRISLDPSWLFILPRLIDSTPRCSSCIVKHWSDTCRSRQWQSILEWRNDLIISDWSILERNQRFFANRRLSSSESSFCRLHWSSGEECTFSFSSLFVCLESIRSKIITRWKREFVHWMEDSSRFTVREDIRSKMVGGTIMSVQSLQVEQTHWSPSSCDERREDQDTPTERL